jgi:hypothetical protein
VAVMTVVVVTVVVMVVMAVVVMAMVVMTMVVMAMMAVAMAAAVAGRRIARGGEDATVSAMAAAVAVRTIRFISDFSRLIQSDYRPGVCPVSALRSPKSDVTGSQEC